ncbi:pyruvate oxidase [Lactobacillus colini]|uniref:Pyruvate oxidase n=1 Tax=Lactobacillus colini TaxID=1819254 RepID=A0ABS4MGS8_9LACO|nr:pyruvate oxidase [Lactobacillus colini]
MTKISGADAMFQVLYDWGIDHIYGLPGGSFDSGMNGIYNWRDRIKFIEVRHEEAGALAAASEYKMTGKLGVCFGSAGPGAVHLMNGLYDAKYDKAPMVAIVANVPTIYQDQGRFQAFDEKPWFDAVAVWNHQVKSKELLPVMMDEAIRQAYAQNGPAVLVVPKDFGWDEIEDSFRVNAANHSAMPNYPEPRKEDVEKAVALIKEAKKPVIYYGIGVRGAGEELKEASNKFKMPIMSSFLGKGIVEDSFPANLGPIGRLGKKPANDVQAQADLVLWVGNDSPFSPDFFPKDAKVIQIDVDSKKFGKRHKVDVAILADGKKTLRAIIDAGEEKAETPLYKAAMADKENWNAWVDKFRDSEEMPVRPEPIWDVINKEADKDAIFAVDVGNVVIDFNRLMTLDNHQIWSTSGLYATMGYGAPASLAAAQLYPDREVWNLSGDGGFAMMSEELLTQARYNMHVLNVVFTNETLGFIEAEQIDDSHQPLSGVKLPDNDWATVAKGMNVKGVTAHNKKEFEAAVKEFKKMNGPMLIDVKYTHEMPYPTKINDLSNPEFVNKYQARGLRPFSEFAKEYGVE